MAGTCRLSGVRCQVSVEVRYQPDRSQARHVKRQRSLRILWPSEQILRQVVHAHAEQAHWSRAGVGLVEKRRQPGGRCSPRRESASSVWLRVMVVKS